MELNRAARLRCFHRSYLTALITSLLWVSLLSPGGGVTTAMADPRTPAGEFELEAPDDVYVTYVAQDGQREANSVLLVLESPMLKYWRLSIDSEKNQVDVTEQKYINGRADEQRRMLEAKTTALSAASKASHDRAVSLAAHAEAGTDTEGDAKQALRDANADESAAVEVASNAKQEMLRQKEEKQKIAKQREKIMAENELYSEMMAHLTVKTVASGTFKSFVVLGSFVKKGHLLGKIAY
jgi:flagellar biosynthesis GTPase FlhF